jgi:DNA helicase HerA-like ATPase
MIQPLEETTQYEEDMENYAQLPNSLSVRLGEHWAIIAKTGEGKTFFATRGLLEYLRTHFPDAKRYVIDSTDDPNMERWCFSPMVVEGNKAPDLLRSSQHTLIWKPRNSKNPLEYARFFEKLNDSREKNVLLVDEMASITRKALESYEGLLKQMRKHGGTVITLGQSFSGLDPDIFRQMTHYTQFRLNDEVYDTAQTRRYLNVSKEEQRPPRYKYGFFYRRTDGDFPVKEYSSMHDFFNESLF